MPAGNTKYVSLIAAVIVCTAVCLAGSDVLSQDVEKEGFVKHSVGRVRLRINDDCTIGAVGGGASAIAPNGKAEEQTSGDWLADSTKVFIGAVGLYLRILDPLAGVSRLIRPGDFRALPGEYSHRSFYEGCKSGRRYPYESADDDDDGLIDEDIIDGEDNDGDGLIDEDFAAVSDNMIVTQSLDEDCGIRMIQNSYAWSYGHMRDFAGFETRIKIDDDSPILEDGGTGIDMALVFKTGAARDGAQAEKTRRFMVFSLDGVSRGGDEGAKRVKFVASNVGGTGNEMVGVLLLGARSLDGEYFSSEAYLAEKGFAKDPFSVIESAYIDNRENGRMRHMRCVRLFSMDAQPVETGESSSESKDVTVTEGDFHDFAYVIDGIPTDKRQIVIDWAVVYGNNEEILLRNAKTAVRTYIGLDDGSRILRWVPPARKAAKVRCKTEVLSIWTNGERKPAVAVDLPANLRYENVEWLKVNGDRTKIFDRAGDKILVRAGTGGRKPSSMTIEGQLTDGTIFEAVFDNDTLNRDQDERSVAEGTLPASCFELFPNPFITTVNIALHLYHLEDGTFINKPQRLTGSGSVRIYDVRGRLVRTIAEVEQIQPGDYSYNWDGLDENGVKVSPGVYYCKLQIGNRSLTKRVILLR